MRKNSFEPLTGVLEPWFESDKLPEAIQERIRLGFPPGDDSPRNRGAMVLAQMWETLGPRARREAARQWDYNNDPANEAEQHRMFKLQNLQSELKDRITKIEIGPIQDAAARDIHLQKLKKELADVEDSIYQLATEAAGATRIVSRPLSSPAPADISASHGRDQNEAPNGTLKRRSNGNDYSVDDLPLIAKMRELITTPGSKVRSPEDAARDVYMGAKGHGIASSKVARLAKRYRAKYPSQP